MRGGEKVLESSAACSRPPTSCTLVHERGSVSPLIESRRIRTSLVQRLPRPRRGCYRHYLPLFPAAIELFDLDDADLVISTSHCAAKSVVPTGRARARLLLPFADAVRLGSVRRVLRAGARRPRRQRARAAGAGVARALGSATRRTASIASSPTRITLPGGSRGTIIDARRCCIRQWIPEFFTPDDARAGTRTFWWCRRSCPTSESMSPSTPPTGSASR